MPRQKRRRGILLSVLLLAVAWALLAPLELGGRLKYILINGSSMLPLMASGDFVIVRAEPSYQVGDVVAYDFPDLGTVIHRIVAQNGEHFVMKGDNNTWTDSYFPTAEEIYGKLWVIIPGIGTVVLALRQPIAFGLLVGFGALLFGMDWAKPQKRTRKRMRD